MVVSEENIVRTLDHILPQKNQDIFKKEIKFESYQWTMQSNNINYNVIDANSTITELNYWYTIN